MKQRHGKSGKKVRKLRCPGANLSFFYFFAQNPNIVFSKEVLFEKIWGFDYVSDAATVSEKKSRMMQEIRKSSKRSGVQAIG